MNYSINVHIWHVNVHEHCIQREFNKLIINKNVLGLFVWTSYHSLLPSGQQEIVIEQVEVHRLGG